MSPKVLYSSLLGDKDIVKWIFLDGLDLNCTKLYSEFLRKWQYVFSKSSTDLGCTELAQHELHLDNEQP